MKSAISIPLGLLLASHVSAADYLVHPGQSIQAAIQNAQDGDRILVQPGTYFEAIDFLGKSIEIVGVAGAAQTVLDGTGQNASVVTFRGGETPSTRLLGLTVRNGTAGSTAELFPGVFYNVGGGIYIATGSSPIIESCRIEKNSALAYGGGIWNGGEGILLRSTVSQNQSAYGGGTAGPLSIDSCTLIENKATLKGGGAFQPKSIRLCRFIGNAAIGSTSSGGGVFSDLIVQIDRCLFQENQAGFQGGAMALRAATGSVKVRNSRLIANSAPNGASAIAPFGPTQNLEVDNCVLANNGPDQAILGFAHTTLRNCTLYNNPGGVMPAGNLTVVNSIFWQQPNPFGPSASVSYSNFSGALPMNGNIDSDPLFADASSGDFHLLAASPCRNAGNLAGAKLSTDFEGDPRMAEGLPDMGADEFVPRLYVHGIPYAGSQVSLRTIGEPNASPVTVFLNNSEQIPPIPTPYGLFHIGLLLPSGQPISLGSLPVSGWKGVSVTVPLTEKLGSQYFGQAFFGGASPALSQLETVTIP